MRNRFLFSSLISLFGIGAPAGTSAYIQTRAAVESPRMFAAAQSNPIIQQINADAATGSSQAVVVDEVPLAHTTQLLPLDKKGELIGKGNILKQVNQVLNNITLALKAADANLNGLVKLNIYLKQADLMPQVQAQLGKQLKGRAKPAVSYVVGDLAHTDLLIAMDAIATTTAANQRVQYFRSAALQNNSPAAHVAVLPAGEVVYVAGQADKGALPEATRGTLKQLEATLMHLGLKKDQVIQLKSFIRPMTDVKVVEKEIASFFAGFTVPPVVYVEWLSQDPVVEIELISAAPVTAASGAPQLEFITPPFMTASPVYSKVTRINHGKKVYVSGLYGKTPASAPAQVTEIFTNLGAILEKAGSSFQHLAKATYYVSDNETSTQLNALRPKYYNPLRPPAASKAMVRGVGATNLGITIDMIGVVAK
ncbi:RidA family protein [Adhaeribacter aerolatus]|nr:RidA family protein [Adhaeribacter aerolatus]